MNEGGPPSFGAQNAKGLYAVRKKILTSKFTLKLQFSTKKHDINHFLSHFLTFYCL